MKHIFITGGSSGIGLAIVEELVKHDFLIHVSIRNNADKQRLESLSAKITGYIADISKHDEIVNCINLLKLNLGEEKISVLINNAGVAEAGPIEFVNLEKVKYEFDVNVFAVIDIIQQIIPIMDEVTGKIINMSSKSGRIALPFTGAYAASKFALEAISDTLRRELSNTGIKIVVIQPGAVKTPIWEKANDIDLSEYKNTRYSNIMATVKDRVIKAGRNGADPKNLAKLLILIIESKRPKRRYIFAKKPFLEIRLLRLLPTGWLDSKIKKALFGKKNS